MHVPCLRDQFEDPADMRFGMHQAELIVLRGGGFAWDQLAEIRLAQ